MKYKMKQYYGMEGLKLGQRPMIDLKHVMVIMNEGSFKGYSRILGKSGLAANMAQWYYQGNWSRIEEYIRLEAADFTNVYSMLKIEIPRLRERVIPGLRG
jgi:hypothetical protein